MCMSTNGRNFRAGAVLLLLVILGGLLFLAGCSGTDRNATAPATPVPTPPTPVSTPAVKNALGPGDIVRGTNVSDPSWLVLRYYPENDQYAVIEVQKIDVRLPDKWTKGYMPVNIRPVIEARGKTEREMPVRVETINLTAPCPEIGSSDLICGDSASRFLGKVESTLPVSRATPPPVTAAPTAVVVTPPVSIPTTVPVRFTTVTQGVPSLLSTPGPLDAHKFNPGDIDTAGDLTLDYNNRTGYYYYVPVDYRIDKASLSPGKSLVPQKMERDRFEGTIVAEGQKRSKIAHFEENEYMKQYSPFKLPTPLIAAPGDKKPVYQEGDIINEAPWISPAWIITGYDLPTDSYLYIPVYPFENATYGYNFEKSFTQVGRQNRYGVETSIPYLVGHMNMTSLYTLRA